MQDWMLWIVVAAFFGLVAFLAWRSSRSRANATKIDGRNVIDRHGTGGAGPGFFGP